MANDGIFPPNYGSMVGQIRLLIGDVDQESGEYNFFSDGELMAYGVLYGGRIRLAAARALDTIADSQALIERKIRTDDLQTDGPAVANALRKSAQNLREEHYTEENAVSGADDIVFSDMPSRDPYGRAEGGFYQLAWEF